ncbi:MAG: hypothetical protein AAFQ94_19070 [Bacteroidota bacterium]
MEILKTAEQWAKDEVFSSKFFMLFGFMFVMATIGFWNLGKTDVAKAFIYPTLVAGILLIIIGAGLFYTNKTRLSTFESAYQENSSAFVKSEISRAEKTVKEYKTIVFKAIPVIIVLAALMIAFIDIPVWRVIAITTIALMVCIIFVDSDALSRMEAYHTYLISNT